MMPLPPEVKTPKGELNENEIDYILTTCLKPRNRKNMKLLSFIESFVRYKSIPQACEESGATPKQGYRWRHSKDIANCIQSIMDKSFVKYGMDATEIFERVKEVIDFDPIHIQNQNGTYRSNLHEIPPETRRCLKSLKAKNIYEQVQDINGMDKQIITGQLIEYTFYDKLKASELAGKEKEMFKNTTKVEHTVTKDMAKLLLDSSKRADAKRVNLDRNTIDITPITESE